jgi:hypothetical protein
MTKINHRENSLHPARRTTAAYDSVELATLAYLDAQFHMATSRNAAPTLRFPIPTVPFREGQEYVQPVRKYPAAPSFGRRGPPRQFACSVNCGSPACTQGCTRNGGPR